MLQRKLYGITGSLKQHFINYRWYYISMCLMLIVGIVCGIVRATAIKTTISIDIIKLTYLNDFLRGKKTAAAFALSHFLCNLLLFGIIFALTIFIYSSPFSYVVIFYRGYVLGLNLYLIGFIIGTGASVVLWIIIFPLEFALSFFICGANTICIHRCINCHKYGHINNGHYLWLVKNIWQHLLGFCIISVIEFVFISFFNNSFILII